MPKIIRFLFQGFQNAARRNQSLAHGDNEPPLQVLAPGAEPFVFSDHFLAGFEWPILDWQAVDDWMKGIEASDCRLDAFARLRKGWLEHVRHFLGPGHVLHETQHAMLVSNLEDSVARAALDYVGKTRQRLLRLLDGMAQPLDAGKEILIVLEKKDHYFDYVSHCYEDGEMRSSNSAFFREGGGHIVLQKADLLEMEPVIAGKLAHGCINHLPIPVWLHVGIAENAAKFLRRDKASPSCLLKMHARHRTFWGGAEIQAFWSGQSFYRVDEGHALSYDLASILVAQLSRDGPLFRDFVLGAGIEDAGAGAAVRHLQCDLGAAVAALLGHSEALAMSPRPAQWSRGTGGNAGSVAS